jgi:hypothetical protein
VVPYSGTKLTLLRDFDPEKGEAKAVATIQTNLNPTLVRLADLNGDGVPELVFSTYYSHKIWAVEYAGSDQAPRLRELASFKKDVRPPHVVPLDVNQDRKMDLLVPMEVRKSIAVLLNDGQGHFTEASPIAYPGQFGVKTLAAGQDRGGRYLLAGGHGALVLYRASSKIFCCLANGRADKGKWSWPTWTAMAGWMRWSPICHHRNRRSSTGHCGILSASCRSIHRTKPNRKHVPSRIVDECRSSPDRDGWPT